MARARVRGAAGGFYLEGVVEVVHAHPLALVALEPPEGALARRGDARDQFPRAGGLPSTAGPLLLLLLLLLLLGASSRHPLAPRPGLLLLKIIIPVRHLMKCSLSPRAQGAACYIHVHGVRLCVGARGLRNRGMQIGES